jgi:hypothetical protein
MGPPADEGTSSTRSAATFLHNHVKVEDVPIRITDIEGTTSPGISHQLLRPLSGRLFHMNMAVMGRRRPLADTEPPDQCGGRRLLGHLCSRQYAALRGYHGNDADVRRSGADQTDPPFGKPPDLHAAGLLGPTGWSISRSPPGVGDTSDVGLIGGGHVPMPGEVSRDHNGVLFLEARPEFRRHVLEVWRQPLDGGIVSIPPRGHLRLQ